MARPAGRRPHRARRSVRAPGDRHGVRAAPLLVIAGATATGKTGPLARSCPRPASGRHSGGGHLGGLEAGVPWPGHRHRQGAAGRAGRRPAPRSRPRRPGRVVLGGALRASCERGARGHPGPWRHRDPGRRDRPVPASGRSRSRRERPAIGPRHACRRRGSACPGGTRCCRQEAPPACSEARRRHGPRQPPAGRAGTGDRRARRRRTATAAAGLSRRGRLARPARPRRAAPRWIAGRARAQFDAGLVEEARGLRERYDPSLPCFSAIGYREAWALLDGEIDRETAIERDAQRNVAFAKRQSTWFRSEPDIEWLSLPDVDPLPIALDRARALLVPA